MMHCALQVRRSVPKISLPMVLELVEAQEWGPSAPRIPPSAAKDRLAEVTAAKAVAMALTPGIDPIKVCSSNHCLRVGIECVSNNTLQSEDVFGAVDGRAQV
jgi:hypothetical protein